MKITRLFVPVLAGLALCLLVLIGAVRQSSAALPETARVYGYSRTDPDHLRTGGPQSAVRYVAASGNDAGDCSDSASPCRTVQYAIDQAGTGDEVRVAAGTYTDMHVRPRQDITTTGMVTQVVYITKTLSLQGGYTLTNWITPDPVANPTILDAGGQGRVMYFTGNISPTVEGLQITGGDSTGLGGYPGRVVDGDVGGGVYIYHASATINNCQIDNNVSYHDGGAIFLLDTTATIQNSAIMSNTAVWGNSGGISTYYGHNLIATNRVLANNAHDRGGGLYIEFGHVVVSNNVFHRNSSGLGGAIYLFYTDADLTNNQMISNTAVSSGGGGVYIYGSDARLTGNQIRENHAFGGGGIEMIGGNLVFYGNTVANNTADHTGGILMTHADGIITNNIIADNHSTTNAAGVMIWGSSTPWNPPITVRMHYNTITRNTGDVGAGVLLADANLITMTNNAIMSQTVGIYADRSNVNLEGTLWGSGAWANGKDWEVYQSTLTTGTVNVWGDPGFIDPDNGNYHIGSSSTAIDAGVDAGIYTDIDGEPRPFGTGFDIGADEAHALLTLTQVASHDPVASGDLLTYTLRLTNTGTTDLHAIITDVLPAQVSPNGTLTWTAFLPAPGGAWMQAVAVRVDPGYAGPLTNTLQVVSPEAGSASAAGVVAAIQPVSGLTAINDSPTSLGAPTTFTASVAAGGQLSYTWDFGDGITGTGAIVSHTFAAPGIYTATIAARNPVSQDSAETIVHVEVPITGLSAANSSPTVLNASTVFTAYLDGGSSPVFSWDFGDGASGIGQVVTHTFPAAGSYTATLSAANAVSAASHQTSVRVASAIAGLSVVNSSPTLLGEPTTFTATLAAGSHVLYRWDFGDGVMGSGQFAMHTYPTFGVFTATLTASNTVSMQITKSTVNITQPMHRLYLPILTIGVNKQSSSDTLVEPYNNLLRSTFTQYGYTGHT
jgi:uncharacterized repeat protein (TIGR01451 family)